MKVMWLSVTPSMYVEGKIGGWIASLEQQIHCYYGDKVDLAILFELDKAAGKDIKNGTTYYPVDKCHEQSYRRKARVSLDVRWEYLLPKIRGAISDFKPDIIHCFGSEWPYGMIAEIVDLPVVIHMQGFLNVYDLSSKLVVTESEERRYLFPDLKRLIKAKWKSKLDINADAFEQKLMKSNHYFMGRTEWDRNIVKYFSPGAKYYHVPEAIRPDIYDAPKLWCYNRKSKIRLITITQAGYLKGNEMILRTAQILKHLIGIDFEWRVAGKKDAFPLFEKKTGIKASNVNVTLLGMIGPEQIVDELAGADFYIHPAIIDNSPNSLCEAQLVGCPVIAANVGGIPQLVDDGKTGFLYPYNEPHTLAFKICNLIDDKELLTAVSKAEIETSRNRHDPKTVADTVYRTYEAVISDYKERFSKP